MKYYYLLLGFGKEFPVLFAISLYSVVWNTFWNFV